MCRIHWRAEKKVNHSQSRLCRSKIRQCLLARTGPPAARAYMQVCGTQGPLPSGVSEAQGQALLVGLGGPAGNLAPAGWSRVSNMGHAPALVAHARWRLLKPLPVEVARFGLGHECVEHEAAEAVERRLAPGRWREERAHRVGRRRARGHLGRAGGAACGQGGAGATEAGGGALRRPSRCARCRRCRPRRRSRPSSASPPAAPALACTRHRSRRRHRPRRRRPLAGAESRQWQGRRRASARCTRADSRRSAHRSCPAPGT